MRLSYTNYTTMYEMLRGVGIPLVLIRYPMNYGGASVANLAMARLAKEHDVPVLDSTTAVRRLPNSERQWLWALHPNGAMYGEIARDLVSIVEHLSGAGARPEEP